MTQTFFFRTVDLGMDFAEEDDVLMLFLDFYWRNTGFCGYWYVEEERVWEGNRKDL